MYVFDWDNFVGLTTAIGSIATAITVIYLYNQRKDSIRPTILIEYSNIITLYKYGVFRIWGYDVTKRKRPFFSLINPGSGLAINLKVKPIYDTNSMIQYIMKLDKLGYFDFETNNNFFTIIKKSDSSKRTFSLGKTEVVRISTLIDMKTDNSKKYDVNFDYGYIYLVEAAEHVIELYGYPVYNVTDFPKVIYKITYKDGFGNKYRSRYSLSLLSLNKVYFSFEKLND